MEGKIVALDLRQPGSGGGLIRFLYSNQTLGPAFLERLFGETQLTLSSDTRQMIDWLAQGRYPLGLWVSSTQIKVASEQGLPVAEVPGEQLKEGAPLSSGSGTVSLAESAPHPAAARVFLNWLLSREGQIAWQANVKQPSLRLDLSKTGLDVSILPKPGIKYVAIGTEEQLASPSTQEVNGLINRALEKGSSQ